jgi:hypothetical protein
MIHSPSHRENQPDLERVGHLMLGLQFVPETEAVKLVSEEGYSKLPREAANFYYKMILLAQCEWAYNMEWAGPAPKIREELLPRIHKLREDLGFDTFVPKDTSSSAKAT